MGGQQQERDMGAARGRALGAAHPAQPHKETSRGMPQPLLI